MLLMQQQQRHRNDAEDEGGCRDVEFDNVVLFWR